MPRACILDVAGERLGADERAFFREADPWAIILFARSCRDRGQMQALTAEIREALGREALIFIDQEGGRVQRMAPPEWPRWPALAFYGALFSADPARALALAREHHRLIGQALREVGVTADCAPCLDLHVPGADAVIGDRSFSADPAVVGVLGRAAMLGLHEAGVASVIKHVPGHGRATGDSHHVLPRVGADARALSADLAPFIACADAPMAMTAHVVYDAFDPAGPATTAPAVIEGVIRGAIGFQGLLMSDDASMKALSGPLADRARAALAAGCDVAMLCNATLADRIAFADACPPLAGAALARARAAEAVAAAPAPAPSDFAAFAERVEAARRGLA